MPKKKSKGADDDKGCQTRMGRTRIRVGADREEARAGQELGSSWAGAGKEQRAGVWPEQGRSWNWEVAGAGQEQSKRWAGAGH